jgi:deoxyribodipyrimidine photolyase-like uncharacterized protein
VDALKTGIYSRNAALDAILSVFAERMKKEGIETVFRIADTNCGLKASEISMQLLRWAETVYENDVDSESKRIKLNIAEIGNQLIVEMKMASAKKKRFSKKILDGCIEDKDTSTLTDVYKDGIRTISVMTEVPE